MIEKIEINLLPVEYRVRKRNFNLPRSIVYPVVAMVVLGAVGAFYTIYLNEREGRLTEEVASVEKEIEANKHVQAEINDLRQKKQVTDQKIRALERISVDREKWVRLLEVFSGSLPTYAWLVSVKEGGEQAVNKIAVEARTYSFPEVAHYMSKLEEAEYIKSVNLTSIDQIQGQDRKVYKFNLICDINTEVGLRPALDGEEHVKEEGAAAGKGSPAAASAGRRRGRTQADDGGSR
jgi:Tfp pilus assembly protein PilN